MTRRCEIELTAWLNATVPGWQERTDAGVIRKVKALRAAFEAGWKARERLAMRNAITRRKLPIRHRFG